MKINTNQITEIIEKWVDPEPFSGVFHITHADEVMYEKGFGFAIRSEEIPNRPNTRFQTASGCKIFTGTAIMQLIEQGKIDFDTRLCDCVDVSFPQFDPEITIRHLLTHSSGITSYFEEDINPDYEVLWQDLPVYRVRSPRDFLPLFPNKPMRFAPGARFEYNDGGFILLGLVVESVTGKKFADVVTENVFKHAGMLDSGYFSTDQLPVRTAYAYIANADHTWRTNFFAVPIVGTSDGGAYVTAPDMVKFWRALEGNKLLNAEMTAQMCACQIATTWESQKTHYGYGVWIEHTDNETKKLFVEGADPAVAFKSVYYLQENMILTMIGNTGDALWPLYRTLADALGL